MSGNVIVLGGKAYPVEPIPFKQLKHVLPAVRMAAVSMATGRIEESAMEAIGTVLAAATRLSMAELDELPIRADEIEPAMKTVMRVTGLVSEEGGKPGEAPAVAGTGTSSTPTSPPASAGPGTRSTA